MSSIGIALKLSAFNTMLVTMLASSGGASYYADHDRHSYLGNASIDRSIVKPAEINPLIQTNASGVYINYMEYLECVGISAAVSAQNRFRSQNEQDAHYDDTSYS